MLRALLLLSGSSSSEKMASYAIYAFCRDIDDFIDEAPEVVDTTEIWQRYKDIMSGDLDEPWVPAFLEVTRQFAIPEVLYQQLIYGCCLDCHELIVYLCRAGGVLLLCCLMVGVDDEPYLGLKTRLGCVLPWLWGLLCSSRIFAVISAKI